LLAGLGLIALLGMGGCAHPSPPTPSTPLGVEGVGVVKIRSGLEKQSLRVAVMARPGEVRIESRSPLGSPLFVLRLSGDAAFAWTAQRGAINPLELAQALGWPQLPDGRELARLILSPQHNQMQWDGATMTVESRNDQGLPESLQWQGHDWQGLGQLRAWSPLSGDEAVWMMPEGAP